ncbi:MAG: menaquinone biosynthesis protein [SAR324 cluster bacterium]|nr:menaquinone biosynthesis protein [SAR324 cluster bacterium]
MMLRLGIIDVLNVLPVYWAILEGQVSVPAQLIKGRVTELNEKLNQGDLDLSVISSFEYAKNPHKYYILPDLSVSAAGPVKSIYLFSEVALDDLQGQKIELTAFSLTSVHLVQFLLQDLNVEFVKGQGSGARATLLIADEAIQRYYKKSDPYVYDLGALWFQKTGLPFVFALWAVRREVWESNPREVQEIHKALVESKALVGDQIEKMAKKHYQGVFPDAKSCEDYLANLHYELTEPYIQGFELFQEKMVTLGKLDSVSAINFTKSL